MAVSCLFTVGAESLGTSFPATCFTISGMGFERSSFDMVAGSCNSASLNSRIWARVRPPTGRSPQTSAKRRTAVAHSWAVLDFGFLSAVHFS